MKSYFAIQWHITDTCDQRCKHCYIRNVHWLINYVVMFSDSCSNWIDNSFKPPQHLLNYVLR